MEDFDAGGMYSFDHVRGFVAVQLHEVDACLTHTFVDCFDCKRKRKRKRKGEGRESGVDDEVRGGVFRRCVVGCILTQQQQPLLNIY